jgi:hypothetical protein
MPKNKIQILQQKLDCSTTSKEAKKSIKEKIKILKNNKTINK